MKPAKDELINWSDIRGPLKRVRPLSEEALQRITKRLLPVLGPSEERKS